MLSTKPGRALKVRGFPRLHLLLDTHDVVSRVYRDDGPGDPAGQVAAQKQRCLGNLLVGDIAFQWGSLCVSLPHVWKAVDSPGSQGLQRPGRDGVYSYVTPAVLVR